MARSHRFGLAVFSAGSLLALSSASSAHADAEPGARAVIRGTGKDVQIVYRAPRAAPAARAVDPVADALRQKRDGATDQTVLAYLDRQRDAMPDVVGADLLRRFRQAGAGDDVIAFISASAAVDIGATAEDAAAVMAMPGSEGAAYGGAYPDLVSSGYPFYGGGYGGYGGGYGSWGNRGMRRGSFKGGHGHDGFHNGFGRNGFFLGFGNGFGPRPHPHPLPAPRMGGTTHAAIGGHRH
jgi:hypothetical protein